MDAADGFGQFGGYEPSVLRSDIERFTLDDAIVALDGAGTYEAALLRHHGDAEAARGEAGHGYHRHGLGIKRSEFPEGWSAADVVDLVNAIIDNPSWIEDDPSDAGFFLYGEFRAQTATLAVRYYGRWMIAAVIPDDIRYHGLHG